MAVGTRALSPARFLDNAKTFAANAIPVGLGYAGMRFLDANVFVRGWLAWVQPFNADKSQMTQNIVNTLFDTTTHMLTAAVGGVFCHKVLKKPGCTYLFAAGVTVNWLRKMATIWLPEGQLRSLLAGDEYQLVNDYVEFAPGGRVNDYVEMNDYVEVTR